MMQYTPSQMVTPPLAATPPLTARKVSSTTRNPMAFAILIALALLWAAVAFHLDALGLPDRVYAFCTGYATYGAVACGWRVIEEALS